MRLTTFLGATVAVLLATVVSAASNVVDLDESNFDSIIGQGTPALVEFFAPWCGHCKNLAPVYESLADAFSPSSSHKSSGNAKPKVIIAKVDADSAEGKSLGGRFGVRGFPTLKWFPANDADTPTDYEGGRDLESLVGFITQQTGVKSGIKPPPPSAVTELDVGNFKAAVGGEKDVLVAFTAPWCGHCKNLKPVWEKVANDFKAEKNVLIAQVNADADENKPLSAEFGVQGYPTIKFFPRGSAVPEDYQGGRSEDAFVDFINERSGTFRAVGGRLLATAGKVLSLDKLASQFFTTTASRPDILKQAQEYVASLSATASDGVKRATKTETTTEYYLKAMQRILEKGEGWVEKETARIGKLLKSTSLAPEKLDELQTKNNILSSFAHRIYDEAEALSDVSLEDVEDAVRHATASAKTIAAQATDRVKAEL